MQALVSSHLHIHKLTTKEFFRSAYIHKFGIDCLDVALANDAKRFDEAGYIHLMLSITSFLSTEYSDETTSLCNRTGASVPVYSSFWWETAT